MQSHTSPLESDQAFFRMLLQADAQGLGRLLSEDFILIEVLGGSEITKNDFLAGIRAGAVVFQRIEPEDVRVRSHGTAAIVTGRTTMDGRAGDRSFSIRSRYTHVYVQRAGAWELASAQGTLIPSA